MYRIAATLAAALLLSGCLSTSNVKHVIDEHRLQSIVRQEGLERDRQAILAMVGEYKVTFAFDETDPSPGYTVKEPKRSGAYEMVLVAEDSGTRIVLQHLLVHRTLGFVLKHWRQDWHYELSHRLEFTDDQTWRVRAIDPAVTRGAWTQCVYEVSDAPRYCGTGKWTYDDGQPLWTSDAGWRPLPRREYSTRSDYNALGVINRHRIVAEGWLHEQDNRKVVREGEREMRTLVHEKGVNTYQRITGYTFAGGYRYWSSAQEYWQRIRGEWSRRIQEYGGLKLTYAVDSEDMLWPMWRQSELARRGEPVTDSEIRRLFDPWVVAP